MSKAREKHAARLEALSLLGKDLTRRSRSHCELCDAHGIKLAPYELKPAQDTPDLERTIFACEVCAGQLNKPKTLSPDHWRCLNTSVWSEVPPVQIVAVRVLKYLAENVEWAADLYDQLYIAPEIAEQIELGDM